jgi:Uma2 family endonuclease
MCSKQMFLLIQKSQYYCIEKQYQIMNNSNKANNPEENTSQKYKPYRTKQAKIQALNDIDLSGTYSYADYISWFIVDRIELIKGRIFVIDAPTTTHQRILGRLYVEFFQYLERRRCEVFLSPYDVRLPAASTAAKDIYSVVQPDLCVVCDPAKIEEKGCLGAPDLIVEILSPTNNRKDLVVKYQLYEENAVREYWIIDPKKKMLTVYALSNELKYQQLDLTEGLSGSLFPDLGLRVGELFEIIW